MDLTEVQWSILEPLLPDPPRRSDGRGKPWNDKYTVLNGILWVLRTGARWGKICQRYGSHQTAHRHFQQWVKNGVLEAVLKALAKDLYERGQIDLSECFIDGTFIMAKKGGAVWAPPSGAKAARSWQLQMLLVFWSPLTLTVLRRMKSDLYKKLSHLDFCIATTTTDRSVIVPMIATSWMQNSKNRASR